MRYSLKMINRNGYEISRKFRSVAACRRFAEWYPLEAFFAWIYDSAQDEMIMQNDYKRSFFKCNNETFVPYWC